MRAAIVPPQKPSRGQAVREPSNAHQQAVPWIVRGGREHPEGSACRREHGTVVDTGEPVLLRWEA
jgi:hypothetical protein